MYVYLFIFLFYLLYLYVYCLCYKWNSVIVCSLLITEISPGFGK